MKHIDQYWERSCFTTKVAPECSFVCGQLARNMHNPGKEHWDSMERLVGYINSKGEHMLVIKRAKEVRVVSFGDSSYGNCKQSRGSSTGDLHTIGGGLVSWHVQRTKCICLSSTEVEYIEMTELTKEQCFIQMALEEVFGEKNQGIMYEDNDAAIYLNKNHHVSPRIKHINIKQHYIREHINNGHGKVMKIESGNNFADILMKNVCVWLFKKFARSVLGGFDGYGQLFSNFQREND